MRFSLYQATLSLAYLLNQYRSARLEACSQRHELRSPYDTITRINICVGSLALTAP